MELTYVYAPSFVREWNRHRLSDSDLIALEEMIREVRDAAPVIRGTGGLRKMRFAPPSRHTGKRGAMRVAFAYFRIKSAIFVMALLAKNEVANFRAGERAELAAQLRRAERNFR